MEQPNIPEPRQRGSFVWRLILILLLLLGLYFGLKMIGLDPVQTEEQEQIIDRPHG